MGDSYMTEVVGLGAFALVAAPALSRFTGGDPTQSPRIVDELRRVTRGTSTRWLVPSEGFADTPLGIDVARVERTGVAPLVNDGLAHRTAGVGQVGAGLTRLPLEPFLEASRALAALQSARVLARPRATDRRRCENPLRLTSHTLPQHTRTPSQSSRSKRT
jgi:hypothetical protein